MTPDLMSPRALRTSCVTLSPTGELCSVGGASLLAHCGGGCTVTQPLVRVNTVKAVHQPCTSPQDPVAAGLQGQVQGSVVQGRVQLLPLHQYAEELVPLHQGQGELASLHQGPVGLEALHQGPVELAALHQGPGPPGYKTTAHFTGEYNPLACT